MFWPKGCSTFPNKLCIFLPYSSFLFPYLLWLPCLSLPVKTLANLWKWLKWLFIIKRWSLPVVYFPCKVTWSLPPWIILWIVWCFHWPFECRLIELGRAPHTLQNIPLPKCYMSIRLGITLTKNKILIWEQSSTLFPSRIPEVPGTGLKSFPFNIWNGYELRNTLSWPDKHMN